MKRLNKKGTVALYLTFVIMAIIIIVMTAVVAPIGAEINAQFYMAGDDIIGRTNNTIANIHNDTIRTSIQSAIAGAQQATQNNIEVSTNLFQYSWIFLILLTALIVFLFSRRIVEYGGIV